MVRKKMELWKKAAMLIQRVVRGWLVRWHMPDYYRAYILRRQRKYYNEKATKIQSLWRGYWVRNGTNEIKIQFFLNLCLKIVRFEKKCA